MCPSCVLSVSWRRVLAQACPVSCVSWPPSALTLKTSPPSCEPRSRISFWKGSLPSSLGRSLQILLRCVRKMPRITMTITSSANKQSSCPCSSRTTSRALRARLKPTICRRWLMFGGQRATEQRVDSHEKSLFDPLIRKVDSLFCRGDEPWSSHRPGIVYIVPTRYATVDDFKATHLSRYMRLKMKMPQMRKKRRPYKRKP